MPSAASNHIQRSDYLSFEEIARLALWLQETYGLAKVHLTGGEPLLRPNLHRLIAMLDALGVPDLALTTNGLRLAEHAEQLRTAGLRRVNVSLDTLDPVVFRELTRGGRVEAVLDGIHRAREVGLNPIKLNTVLIRGVNDREIERLIEFAIVNGCELRFIELMPIGPGAALFATGHMSAAEVRERLGQQYALEPLGRRVGTSSVRYHVRDKAGREGIIGFIAPCSEPFCSDCRRLRVTADGQILGCLAREDGRSVREALRRGDRQAVLDAVQNAMAAKRDSAEFTSSCACMAGIGG